jgi:hypothetical protein
MTSLIVFLVFAIVITLVFVLKKKKTIVIPPPPPPVTEPTYYIFDVVISETPSDIMSQVSRFKVMGLNYEFCSNIEYINLDGVFSSYNSEQVLYLLNDNKMVEVRRGGENALTRISDCTEQL